MKLQVEIKEGNRVTTYSVDLTKTKEAVKSVADKVEAFLKETFKKETFVKETKEE